jgi:hypothetical protein
VIVVDDSLNYWAMYVMQVGTDTMRGTFSLYLKDGGEPSQFYPVRGFRTASRTFVEEGVGPAKRTPAAAGKRKGTDTGLGALLEGLAAFDKVGATKLQPSGDAERLTQIRRSLEQRLSGAR